MSKKTTIEEQPKELLTLLEAAKLLGIDPKDVLKNARKYHALQVRDKTPWVIWARYTEGAAKANEQPAPAKPLKKMDTMASRIGLLKSDLGLREISKRTKLTIPEQIEAAERALKIAQNSLRLAETSRDKVIAMKEVAKSETALAKHRARFDKASAELQQLLSDPRWDADLKKMTDSGTKTV